MKLLLIAGMGESIALARDLCALPGVEVICVTEGRAVARAAPPAKTYDGRLDTVADVVAFLRAYSIEFVVDAAHPFQSRLGSMVAPSGLPYLRATRPPWAQNKGEHWITAPDTTAAIDAIPTGSTLFVVTGRGTLDQLKPRTDLTVYCRQLDRHDQEFPLEKGRYVFGQGPFAVDDEIALFKLLGINTILMRNSGSVAGKTKLEAARHLGITIVMIDPPSLQIDADQAVEIDQIPQKVRDFASN